MSIFSILLFVFVAIAAIVNGLAKAGKQSRVPNPQQSQRPPRSEEGFDLRGNPWEEGRYEQQPRTEEVYKSQPRSFRADPVASRLPSSDSAQGQVQGPAPYRTVPAGRPITDGNERKQQSAYDWAFGTPLPPVANEQQKANRAANRPNDEADDDLQILQPSVRVDLTEMHESVHEQVNPVHETILVRRHKTDQPATQPAPKSHRGSGFHVGNKLSRSDLARALVLGEVLGEPRAKRPWRPKTRR